MKKKRLTDNQSELVAAFLPQKLQKNRKLSTSVKLVLANIYQLYYYDNNYGKRTVFRTREDFMKDIDAKDKNEVLRPHAVLMQNDMVYIKSGVRGRATEYTLNDELYAMLPKQIRGEVSEKFAETLNCNSLSNSNLKIEESEVISPSRNELSYSGLQHSNVPSETDTEIEIEKNTYSTSTRTQVDVNVEVVTDGVGTISAETVKASAHKDSSSSIEEEMASAYEASAPEHISADEDDLISTVTNGSVGYEDAKVTSTDEETIPEADIISADDSSTSTEDELTDEADLTSVDSSNDDLNLTDRFTYPQSEDKNPPQVAPNPPLTEFQNNVKQAIRKGVYDWSLTLENVPKYITHDDYNPIVIDALRAQPDHKRYMGAFPLSDLDLYAKELMENRIKNRDIPAIVSENQYRIRHEAAIKELMGK